MSDMLRNLFSKLYTPCYQPKDAQSLTIVFGEAALTHLCGMFTRKGTTQISNFKRRLYHLLWVPFFTGDVSRNIFNVCSLSALAVEGFQRDVFRDSEIQPLQRSMWTPGREPSHTVRFGTTAGHVALTEFEPRSDHRNVS